VHLSTMNTHENECVKAICCENRFAPKGLNYKTQNIEKINVRNFSFPVAIRNILFSISE